MIDGCRRFPEAVHNGGAAHEGCAEGRECDLDMPGRVDGIIANDLPLEEG